MKYKPTLHQNRWSPKSEYPTEEKLNSSLHACVMQCIVYHDKVECGLHVIDLE